MTRLQVIEGGGDIVSELERLTALAREGKIKMILCVRLDDEETIINNWAYREDVGRQWATALGLASRLNHALHEVDEF